jgi:hypothetical protein
MLTPAKRAKPTAPKVKTIPNSYLERARTNPIMMIKLIQAANISLKVNCAGNSITRCFK